MEKKMHSHLRSKVYKDLIKWNILLPHGSEITGLEFMLRLYELKYFHADSWMLMATLFILINVWKQQHVFSNWNDKLWYIMVKHFSNVAKEMSYYFIWRKERDFNTQLKEGNYSESIYTVWFQYV